MPRAGRARPGAAGLGAGSDAAPPPRGLAAFPSRRAPVTVTASPPRRHEPRRAAPPAPRSGTCRAGGAGWKSLCCALGPGAAPEGAAGGPGRAGPRCAGAGGVGSARSGDPGIHRSGDPAIQRSPPRAPAGPWVSSARRSAAESPAEQRGVCRPCPHYPPPLPPHQVQFVLGSSRRVRKQKKRRGERVGWEVVCRL